MMFSEGLGIRHLQHEIFARLLLPRGCPRNEFDDSWRHFRDVVEVVAEAKEDDKGLVVNHLLLVCRKAVRRAEVVSIIVEVAHR